MVKIAKNNQTKLSTPKEEQTLLLLIYSVLYLLSYLTIRGIIEYGNLYTVSPYHQKN